MNKTPSMRRFENGLLKLLDEDVEYTQRFYWANVCPPCRENRALGCGRAARIFFVMYQMMQTQEVNVDA
jgi:hypothetical protein